MNFTDVFKALNQASAFELYRMRAAIDRVLEEPLHSGPIQARLHVGQTLGYFNARVNALKRAQILELRRKQALVMDLEDGKEWLVTYAAFNLDEIGVEIREHKQQGLGRNEVAEGEVVGFLDRNLQQRSGRIIRMNDKTVTLLCDGRQWRVAYAFLHRVFDSEANAADHDILELEVMPPRE